MRKAVLAVLLLGLLASLQANVVLGVHSPPMDWNGLARMKSLFGNRGGYLIEVVYSTDIDWLQGAADGFRRVAQSGFTPIVRVDYARPDASAWANDVDTFGATVPMQGSVGWCLQRKGGRSRYVGNGLHIDCYIQYIKDFANACPECHKWVIGNEQNMMAEAKGFPGGKIPENWMAEVYRKARQAIRSVPGHGGDEVYMGATAPGPAGGPRYADGDQYLANVLKNLKTNEVDGVAIHAYGGWPNGNPTSMQIFTPTYQATMKKIDSVGHKQAKIIITEFSSHSDQSRIGGSVQFLKDAVKSVAEWNKANHKIQGMIWFVWDHGGFVTESMARWPQLQQAFTSLINERKYTVNSDMEFDAAEDEDDDDEEADQQMLKELFQKLKEKFSKKKQPEEKTPVSAKLSCYDECSIAFAGSDYLFRRCVAKCP